MRQSNNTLMVFLYIFVNVFKQELNENQQRIQRYLQYYNEKLQLYSSFAKIETDFFNNKEYFNLKAIENERFFNELNNSLKEEENKIFEKYKTKDNNIDIKNINFIKEYESFEESENLKKTKFFTEKGNRYYFQKLMQNEKDIDYIQKTTDLNPIETIYVSNFDTRPKTNETSQSYTSFELEKTISEYKTCFDLDEKAKNGDNKAIYLLSKLDSLPTNYEKFTFIRQEIEKQKRLIDLSLVPLGLTQEQATNFKNAFKEENLINGILSSKELMDAYVNSLPSSLQKEFEKYVEVYTKNIIVNGPTSYKILKDKVNNLDENTIDFLDSINEEKQEFLNSIYGENIEDKQVYFDKDFKLDLNRNKENNNSIAIYDFLTNSIQEKDKLLKKREELQSNIISQYINPNIESGQFETKDGKKLRLNISKQEFNNHFKNLVEQQTGFENVPDINKLYQLQNNLIQARANIDIDKISFFKENEEYLEKAFNGKKEDLESLKNNKEFLKNAKEKLGFEKDKEKDEEENDKVFLKTFKQEYNKYLKYKKTEKEFVNGAINQQKWVNENKQKDKKINPILKEYSIVVENEIKTAMIQKEIHKVQRTLSDKKLTETQNINQTHSRAIQNTGLDFYGLLGALKKDENFNQKSSFNLVKFLTHQLNDTKSNEYSKRKKDEEKFKETGFLNLEKEKNDLISENKKKINLINTEVNVKTQVANVNRFKVEENIKKLPFNHKDFYKKIQRMHKNLETASEKYFKEQGYNFDDTQKKHFLEGIASKYAEKVKKKKNGSKLTKEENALSYSQNYFIKLPKSFKYGKKEEKLAKMYVEYNLEVLEYSHKNLNDNFIKNNGLKIDLNKEEINEITNFYEGFANTNSDNMKYLAVFTDILGNSYDKMLKNKNEGLEGYLKIFNDNKNYQIKIDEDVFVSSLKKVYDKLEGKNIEEKINSFNKVMEEFYNQVYTKEVKVKEEKLEQNEISKTLKNKEEEKIREEIVEKLRENIEKIEFKDIILKTQQVNKNENNLMDDKEKENSRNVLYDKEMEKLKNKKITNSLVLS